MSHTDIIINQNSFHENGEFKKIQSEDVLAPGYFWRLKNDFLIVNPRWKEHSDKFYAGDIHLLLDVFEYDGVAHTVTILCHPRNGSNQEYKILIADFLANFEPEKDADAIRAKEQAAVMQQVQDIQSDMETAQVNPLALPSMKKSIDEAMSKFDQEQVVKAQVEEKTQTERTTDLRKLHRRAARRSENAGNPLTVRSVTISDQVGLMISGGIDSQGLNELTYEAQRRIVIAETTAKWLTTKSNQISDVLKSLTPYYAEKGKVALARANKAITYVKDITQGLKSLKLYTGDGVDVMTVTEGKNALSSEPLTLVQGKRYMDEELAVWADIDHSFDWRDQSQFFKALKETPSLVNQLFPTQRCVVSMAVTRRNISYSSKEYTAFELAMNEIKNRSVFLMIRDGDNIHAVYSCEPSHEAATHLFPTRSEIDEPFQGIDGSKIGLQDVAFSASKEQFENTSLHYKRFLILLCGLDHRLKLMGDFYPVEQSLNFMSLDFQSKYFRFLTDAESDYLIGNNLESVSSWMDRCNKAIKSGSRIVITSSGLSESSPQLKRTNSSVINYKKQPDQHIVTRTKDHHCITVETEMRRDHWGEVPKQNTATVWLDGPENNDKNWFLCMDLVRLNDVRRYIYSRTNRIGDIAWLRVFKRAEVILVKEHLAQQELRALLANAALENNILSHNAVDEAIEEAISSWRAAHRGADAPAANDIKSVNEILTLMFPSEKIVQSTQILIDALIEGSEMKPLFMTRTGKNKFFLYVEANEQDKTPYGTGVYWGWVKRLQINILKTKASIGSSSFVWLEKNKLNADESIVREWTDYTKWMHACAAPSALKSLESMKLQMASVETQLAAMLARGRGQPKINEIPEEFFKQLIVDAKITYKEMKYCSDIYLALPVGIIQYSPSNMLGTSQQSGYKASPVLFHYAMTKAYNFIKMYGSDSQISQYNKEILKYFPPKAIQQMNAKDVMKWRLVDTKEPFKTYTLNDHSNRSIPSASIINSHKSGGIKRKARTNDWHNKTTRAQRRAKGGMPRHESADFSLSWNRAIESILGIAPHLKRVFDNDVWNKRDKKVYVPIKPLFDFSSLIWNEKKERSIANKYFSIENQH